MHTSQWATNTSLDSGVEDAELNDDKYTNQANTTSDPNKSEERERETMSYKLLCLQIVLNGHRPIVEFQQTPLWLYWTEMKKARPTFMRFMTRR